MLVGLYTFCSSKFREATRSEVTAACGSMRLCRTEHIASVSFMLPSRARNRNETSKTNVAYPLAVNPLETVCPAEATLHTSKADIMRRSGNRLNSPGWLGRSNVT